MRSDLIATLAFDAHLLTGSTVAAYAPLDPMGGQNLWTLFFAAPLLFFGAGQFLRARSVSRGDGATVTRPLASNHRLAIVCVLGVPLGAWVAAVILSTVSDLLIRWCLVTLAPLFLLAIAYWAERPRRGATLLLTRAGMSALFLTYFVSLFELSQTSRSNARELASAVAANSQPTDLMVITPEWLVSSFNHYYRMPLEQIDYPHIGREERVAFTGMLPRFRDERTATEVRERLSLAKTSGRRVWLIIDPDDLYPFSETVMRHLVESPNYGRVARARTNQIHLQLDSLYGTPDTVTTIGPAPRYEDLRAFLYTPKGTPRTND